MPYLDVEEKTTGRTFRLQYDGKPLSPGEVRGAIYAALKQEGAIRPGKASFDSLSIPQASGDSASFFSAPQTGLGQMGTPRRPEKLGPPVVQPGQPIPGGFAGLAAPTTDPFGSQLPLATSLTAQGDYASMERNRRTREILGQRTQDLLAASTRASYDNIAPMLGNPLTASPAEALRPWERPNLPGIPEGFEPGIGYRGAYGGGGITQQEVQALRNYSQYNNPFMEALRAAGGAQTDLNAAILQNTDSDALAAQYIRDQTANQDPATIAGRSFSRSIPRTAMSVAAMLGVGGAAGAASAPLAGPAAPVVAPVVGTIASIAAPFVPGFNEKVSEANDWLRSRLYGPQTAQAIAEGEYQDTQSDPIASTVGRVGSNAPFFAFNPGATAKQLGFLGSLARPGAIAAQRAAMGDAAFAREVADAAGTFVPAAAGLGRNIKEGRSPLETGLELVGDLGFSSPNKFGQTLTGAAHRAGELVGRPIGAVVERLPGVRDLQARQVASAAIEQGVDHNAYARESGGIRPQYSETPKTLDEAIAERGQLERQEAIENPLNLPPDVDVGIGVSNWRELSDALMLETELGGFGYNKEEADNTAISVESFARGWAERNGRSVEDFYRENLPIVLSGGFRMAKRLIAQDMAADAKAAGKKFDPNDPITKAAIAKGASNVHGVRIITSLSDGQLFGLMAALSKPDASAGIHEAWHVFSEALTQAEKDTLGDALGIAPGERYLSNGVWQGPAGEVIARTGEEYLLTGEAPNASLAGIFQKFKDWLGAIHQYWMGYHKASGGRRAVLFKMGAVPISPEVRAVLDPLFADVSDLTGGQDGTGTGKQGDRGGPPDGGSSGRVPGGSGEILPVPAGDAGGATGAGVVELAPSPADSQRGVTGTTPGFDSGEQSGTGRPPVLRTGGDDALGGVPADDASGVGEVRPEGPDRDGRGPGTDAATRLPVVRAEKYRDENGAIQEAQLTQPLADRWDAAFEQYRKEIPTDEDDTAFSRWQEAIWQIAKDAAESQNAEAATSPTEAVAPTVDEPSPATAEPATSAEGSPYAMDTEEPTPQGKTVTATIDGKKQEIGLPPDLAEKWDAADAEYESRIRSAGMAGDMADKVRRSAGMARSTVRREIVKELRAREEQSGEVLDDPIVRFQRVDPDEEKIAAANWVTPADAIAALGPNLPRYLDSMIDFIAEQRAKAVEGRMTLRDIVKSLVITVGSQGVDAKPLSTVAKNFHKLGMNLPEIPERFLVVRNGERYIRPEEFCAWWLGSETGQIALNDLEAGRMSGAWKELEALRGGIWGRNPITNTGLLSQSSSKLSLPKLAADPNFLQDFNDAVSIFAQSGRARLLNDVLQRLPGVSEGKIGFLKALLGFGDTATVDSRELQYWLQNNPEILAKLANREKLPAGEQREIYDRIKERVAAVAESHPALRDMDPQTATYLVHHWLWDKVNNTETTHEGLQFAARYYTQDTKPDQADEPKEKTPFWTAVSTGIKGSMLTSPTSPIKNVLSSGTMQGTELGADYVGAAVDLARVALAKKLGGKAQALLGDGRTLSAPTLEAMQNARTASVEKGWKKIPELLKTGKLSGDDKFDEGRVYDALGIDREVHTGHKLLDYYLNGPFRVAGALDRPFKEWAYQISLESQARILAEDEAAKSKEAGRPLSKAEIQARTRDIIQNPPEWMELTAIGDAEVSTFNNASLLPDKIQEQLRPMREAARAGHGAAMVGNFAVDRVMPFIRVPFNAMVRTVADYAAGMAVAPVRAGFQIWSENSTAPKREQYIQALRDATLDRNARKQLEAKFKKVAESHFGDKERKEFAKTFGRGAVGSLVMTLGYALAESGLITGYDLSQDERKKRKEAGAMGGSLRLPAGFVPGIDEDVYIPLSWMAPVGPLLLMGATVREHQGETGGDALGNLGVAARAAGESITDAPPLSNVETIQGLASGEAKSWKRFAGGLAAQSVPAAVSNVADLLDDKGRKVDYEDNPLNVVLASVASKVPGARNTLGESEGPRKHPLALGAAVGTEPERKPDRRAVEAGPDIFTVSQLRKRLVDIRVKKGLERLAPERRTEEAEQKLRSQLTAAYKEASIESLRRAIEQYK